MRAVLVCLVGACAAPRAEIATPRPLPATVMVAPPPPPIEPSLPAGGCSIDGQTISIAGDSIELCGALGTACFGRLPAHTYTGAIVESLRVAPSLAAQMIVSANGITVSAIVDARNVAPHPQKVEVIDRWFVPEWARLGFVRVRDGAAELSVEHGSDLTPTAPLTVNWACDRLTSDMPRFDLTDVEDAMRLGRQVEIFNAPTTGTLDIRESPRGAPVAKLECHEQVVWVYARAGGRVRGVIPVDGGWAIGWIDAAQLKRPARGGHRTRAPTVRTSIDVNGVRCDHDVDVLAQVGDATVHAATIHAGTFFDPKDAAEVFRRVGVELAPGVSARVAAGQIPNRLIQR